MTVDDFLAQLMGLQKHLTPEQPQRGADRKRLALWLLARSDPGFRREVFDRHELGRRTVVPRIDPRRSLDDELLIRDAWSYLDRLYEDVILEKQRIRRLTASKFDDSIPAGAESVDNAD